jgi:biopolymer transport protein ExbD
MSRNRTLRKLLRRQKRPGELLLVPMIDIFTVLVTFLLMTAVFSRTVILELRLPTAGSPQLELPENLQLEVILRAQHLQVADRNTGPLATFERPSAQAPQDLAALSTYLQGVKAKFPQLTEATLLVEPDIAYDEIVQVMDTVRVVEQRQEGQLVQAQLFPSISMGDAPDIGAPRGGRP